LAPVGLAQRLLRPFHPADVEVDARPARDVPLGIPDGHTLRQHVMIAAVGAENAVLAVPRRAPPDAVQPRLCGRLPVVGMQDAGPAEAGALLLRHAREPQEGVARIEVVAGGIADPDAVLDGLADGPVQLLARHQRPLRLLPRGYLAGEGLV